MSSSLPQPGMKEEEKSGGTKKVRGRPSFFVGLKKGEEEEVGNWESEESTSAGEGGEIR